MTTYGPHRPEDAPTTVTVRRDRWSGETQEPMPPALLNQRAAINAHAEGKRLNYLEAAGH